MQLLIYFSIFLIHYKSKFKGILAELEEEVVKENPKSDQRSELNLLVITVATEKTDGYNRFKRSADLYGLDVLTLGLNQEWRGGDVRNYPGGGQKVNLLRRALRDIGSGQIVLPPSFFPKEATTKDDIINEVSASVREDRDFLAQIKQSDHLHRLIVLFTDSYDVIFAGNSSDILKEYKSTGAGILFSAEPFCWPDQSLADKYPAIAGKNRYLNSGGLIGDFESLSGMLRIGEMSTDLDLSQNEGADDIIGETEDDQFFYTKIYLDPELRASYNMKLDHKNRLFQNLNGMLEDELQYTTLQEASQSTFDYPSVTPSDLFHASRPQAVSKAPGDVIIAYNTATRSKPKIIHGNGPSKVRLNYIGNYVPGAWSSSEGCLECKENGFNLRGKPKIEYPFVFMSLNVMVPTPFFKESLAKIANLDYPKDRIHLDIYTQTEFHDQHVSAFLAAHSNSYSSHEWVKAEIGGSSKGAKGEIPSSDGLQQSARKSDAEDTTGSDDVYGQHNIAQIAAKARDDAMVRFMKNPHKPDYFFVVDSECHLDNAKTLLLLIEQNRSVLAPMVARPGKMWTNFWGALSPSGYYARSDNYMDIVISKQQGIFNVPFITTCYLIKRFKIASWFDLPIDAEPTPELLSQDNFLAPFTHRTLDSDMAFCYHLRWNGDFMFVTNLHVYGHLVDADYYETNHFNNDLYQIFENPKDWEEAYIHPDWKKQLDPEYKIQEPCPDVYWFPMVTDRFCDELVAEMDHLDEWSGGKHEDQRLAGGYENVPTDDTHMKQAGLERHWLHILKTYVTPIQVKVYPGYHHDPPEAFMNFVVRYKPTLQAFLRPHHDSSTYTINLALNRPHIDYEGGGVNFIRYNCSVVDTMKGWSFIHPGRLTHYHEGLLITKGTRYIMVSFVDP